MKKIIVLLFLLLANINPTQAVLKEKDLAQALSILRAELEAYQQDQTNRLARMEQNQKNIGNRQIARMQEIDQIALMLYSQKNDYIFDLSYACHEATQAYQSYAERSLPFESFKTRMSTEIERYDGLITSLKGIPPFLLKDNDKAREDRDICLQIAQDIRLKLIDRRSTLEEMQERNSVILDKLKAMNDYAVNRYNSIQQDVFVNGGNSYFSVIGNFSRSWRNAKKSLTEKYTPSNKTQSEWRGPIILYLFIFVLFYVIVSSLLCYIIIRWLLRKRFDSDVSKRKRPYIILAASVLLFAAVVMVLRMFVLEHNFFLMASKLLVEYAWLVGAVLVSMLVRLKAKQIKSGFRIYIPILFVGLVVIIFRIIFIPNEMVNLLFPPILLLCTLWQWNVIHRHNKNIPRSDIFYTWISLAIMTVSVVVSWSGYTLLAVQIVIWWIMLLTAIQTITCIYDLLSIYEHKKYKGVNDISRTWFYDLVRKVAVPVFAVYAVMISIYWAASVFDLTEWCKTIFSYNFIDIKDVAQISLSKILLVVALFFVVKYIIYAGKAFYYKYHNNKYGDKRQVSSLGINIATIIVWTLYVIIAILILNINKTGLAVAIGGMSTGIGFALKDTLENLFYGISLMTGRLNVGDVIECDGVRGKVTNINYQSTLIEPIDGSVMAFLNSQLFQKNFKNLTRNHGYELVKIPVGVAYGTNVERARELVLARIKTLNCYKKDGTVSILFENFGDNSVDLVVTIWVPVYTKVQSVSEIKENIYNVFNENGIEIPFPQRDIYIHQVEKKN